jgi:tRNA threonylcarbamoyladenosine biosynthesis protein TsaE
VFGPSFQAYFRHACVAKNKIPHQLPTSEELALVTATNSIDLPDIEATFRFGRAFGTLLFPGAVIGLVGPLGAGKTHLARAIAEGLDIPNSSVVNSPTFVLIQEYQARLPIFHFDAYRLGTMQEFVELGVHEYFESGGVCLIEWADRVPQALPREFLQISIEVTGETTRRATLEARGERYIALCECEGLAAATTPPAPPSEGGEK